MPMIEFRNVNKWFGDFHVLKNINETVEKGEVLVICGPSGSGKSTLVRCVNRLEDVNNGEIIINGRNVTDKTQDLNALRAEIGIVFQQFNLYPHLTVLKNITLAPMKVKKVSRGEAEKTALRLLERVGIGNQAHKYPVELSGGQQQRVAIARALAMQPQVMLFDEPTGNLDSRSGEEIMRIFHDLNAVREITVVFVTHDPDIAAETRRVIRIHDGRIDSDELRGNT